jgi:signal transduction histidine kinase
MRQPDIDRVAAGRLQRLLDVGRLLVAEHQTDVVLELVLDAARELTGARYAALGVLDRERRTLDRFITAGVDEETRRAIGELPHGRGILGVLIDDPRPLRLRDLSEHPRSYGFPPGHPPMTSFLGVPVRVGGEAFGNLYLTDKADGEFDERDEETVVVLAEWASIAIANARLYEDLRVHRDQLERAVARLEATTSIARVLAGETDLERILELLVKRGRALVEARSMVVALTDGDELLVTAVAGERQDDLLGQRVPIHGSVGGYTLATLRPQRLADAPRTANAWLAATIGATGELMVPMVFRGSALGVLAAFDRLQDGPQFSPDDEQMMEAFASAAATAVATAQSVASDALRRSVDASERERTRWARELHDATLQELVALKMELEALASRELTADASAGLARALDRSSQSISSLRELISDLRPPVLDELGMAAALEALGERVNELSGVRVIVGTDLDFEAGRAPARHAAEVEDTLFRITQEALANAVRHGHPSTIEVSLTDDDGRVHLMISDDGAGFDTSKPRRGFGLLGMSERATTLGGTLSVESQPGHGTTVHVELPALPRAEDDAVRGAA